MRRRAGCLSPHRCYGLFQVVATLAIGGIAHRLTGRLDDTIVAMVLWLPVLHALALAGGFWLAQRHDPSPARQRSGLARRLATYGYECYASVRLLDGLQPWRAGFRECVPRPPVRRVAVLCLHGYGCNRAAWLPMQRRLSAQGYPCHAIDLAPLLASIDHYSDDIARHVECLHRDTGLPIVLLCHSMGGIAARAFLRHHPDASVAHIITLGSPHHGTRHAGLGLGENARQMRYDSPWLAALTAHEARHHATRITSRFTSIYSWHDNVVYPVASSHLEGARNLALDNIGHVSLILHPRALALIEQTLANVARVQRID